MSHENFKTIGHCVGGSKQYATNSMEGDIIKTAQKLLIGSYVQCDRKKSMIVSDNTKQAEGLGKLFRNLRRSSVKAGKNLAMIKKKSPGKALESGAKNGSAAVS